MRRGFPHEGEWSSEVGGGPDKKLPYLDLPSVALSVRDSVREERSRKQIRAVPDIPMSPRAAYGTGEAVPYARSPLHLSVRDSVREERSRTESLTDRGHRRKVEVRQLFIRQCSLWKR